MSSRAESPTIVGDSDDEGQSQPGNPLFNIPIRQRRMWISVDDHSVLSLGELAMLRNLETLALRVDMLAETVTQLQDELHSFTDQQPGSVGSGDHGRSPSHAEDHQGPVRAYDDLLQEVAVLDRVFKTYVGELEQGLDVPPSRGIPIAADDFLDAAKDMLPSFAEAAHAARIIERLCTLEWFQVTDLYLFLTERYEDTMRANQASQLESIAEDALGEDEPGQA